MTYDKDYKRREDNGWKSSKNSLKMQHTYFSKVTDTRTYIDIRNILEYVDGEYQITNKITDKNLQRNESIIWMIQTIEEF